MGMFGRLFGRGKEELEGQQPEEAGQAPAEQPPAPAPAAPEPAAPAAEPKRGFFGKVKDRLRGKAKKAAVPPAEEAPPSAPPAPPGPPGPPAAPPTGGGGEEGGEPGGEEAGGGEEAEKEDPYANAPHSLTVSIHGTWKTSKRRWTGVVEGTLKGKHVVTFLKAMDEGTEAEIQEVIQLVCDDFGDGSFGSAVELDGSTWSTPSY
ncbi:MULTISPECIES: hypothetical protein [unclassified Streptomyces]|uniref:hypothetical protein n=1 Tax=unclassified Streptomyces TaxID=2593676 RepID=UPI0022553D3D|nr:MULTISPECIES: hypothetical protein [unclassified Streptomyces]MCX4871107.1 hypothetical protein [Streptomyces sp. NBC_00906]MCX4902729.1 hypothetical protein [Streptomyces sp. NBC_00892]